MRDLLKSTSMIVVAILIIAVVFIDTKKASESSTDNKKFVNIYYSSNITQK